MDSVHVARRIGRTRTSRNRRAFSPMRPEALEERTLLSLSLLQNINPVALFPTEITGAGGNVYFVTTTADGGTDLDVKTATGVTVLKEFPPSNYGLRDSVPQVSNLTAVGSKLFFSPTSTNGQQLWVTNGTAAGTRLVKNVSAVAEPDGRGLRALFHRRRVARQRSRTSGCSRATARPPAPSRSRCRRAPPNRATPPAAWSATTARSISASVSELMKTERGQDQPSSASSPHHTRTGSTRFRRGSDRRRWTVVLHVHRPIGEDDGPLRDQRDRARHHAAERLRQYDRQQRRRRCLPALELHGGGVRALLRGR